MILLLAVLCAVLALTVVLTALNVSQSNRLVPARAPATPRVSVMVPARDEVECIERCLLSLRAQSYANLEVLVLDDGSTDGTSEVLAALRAKWPSLVVLEGTPLPPGWRGKPWACQQLAARATGEYLVFVDADTEMDPHVIDSVMAEVLAGAHGFYTLFPRVVTHGFWVDLLMPCITVMQDSFFHARSIRESRDPRSGLANGQFILMSRELYGRIGGHEAVRASIIEDMALGQRAKALGVVPRVVLPGAAMRTHMYRSLDDFWQGFAKNLFPLMGESLLIAAGYIGVGLFVFVLPFVLLVLSSGPVERALAIAAVLMVLAGRVSLRIGYGLPFYTAPLTWLAIPLWMCVVVSSVRMGLRGGYVWKGRTYSGERR